MKMLRKILVTIVMMLLWSGVSFAQSSLNNNPDAIVGKYSTNRGGMDAKVKVTKNSNGTYNAQIYWVKNPYDEKGNPLTDVKNPNKELRNTPCNKVYIFKGMKYNPSKKCWDGAKIYDPTYGLNANGSIKFLDNGKLQLKGTLMGISQTNDWTPIKD